MHFQLARYALHTRNAAQHNARVQGYAGNALKNAPWASIPNTTHNMCRIWGFSLHSAEETDMDATNNPSESIYQKAIWDVIGDIQGFNRFDDQTTHAAYMSIRQSYADFRAASNQLVPKAAAKQEPEERRAAVAQLEQALNLSTGMIETHIRTIKQKGSINARKGLYLLQNAADGLKHYASSLCRTLRAG